MENIFSNIKIIDYFVIFETISENIILNEQNGIDLYSDYSSDNISDNDNNSNFDLVSNYKNNLNSNYRLKKSKTSVKEIQNKIKINYKYEILNIFPKKNNSKEIKYSLNLKAIFTLLPIEYGYIHKNKDKFFSLIFTNEHGDHYYGFFLKKYFPKNIKNNKLETTLYLSKYLSFFSQNPFFFSFKKILNEIYNQSTLNNSKQYKIEEIINIFLFYLYLPKYNSIQLLFCLNENIYTFINSNFNNEISFRLLFTYISPKNLVMIILSILMHSIIVIYHNNMELISPIIYSLFELIFPFSNNYSVVSNLNDLVLLQSFSGAIFGIYSKNFKNINDILEVNNSNYIVLDLENDILYIEHNEYLLQEKFPVERIKKLITNLSKFSLMSSNKKKKKKDLDSFFNEKNNNKIDINNDIKIRSIFFNFILELFENYDENKYYSIDLENYHKNFLLDKFIEESKEDIKPFLRYLKEQPTFDIFIQNLNHIVDQKYKNNILKNNNENINNNININPSLNEKSLINNFEYIYEIFNKCLELKKNNNLNFESYFTLNINHCISVQNPKLYTENFNYLQNNIFEDKINEKYILNHLSNIHNNSKNLNFVYFDINLKKINDNINIFNNIENINNSENFDLEENVNLNDKNLYLKIINIFKEEILKNYKIFNLFYQIESNKEINYYLKTKEINYENSHKLNDNKNNNILSKNKYLKNFENLYKILNYNNNNDDSMLENNVFINIGINIYSTISICDYCKKPNDNWQIKKTLIYDKNKNINTCKCLFCSHYYIPYFYIFEEKKENKIKTIKKIEYFSLEFIYDILSNKIGMKFNIEELFYNILLYICDIKIKFNYSNYSFELLNIIDFINIYNKNNINQDNNNLIESYLNNHKNVINIIKPPIKKKKEKKLMNIKLNLNTITNDNKYYQFKKEMDIISHNKNILKRNSIKIDDLEISFRKKK